VGSAEFCSTFNMVQNLALSISPRHSAYYGSGRCRVMLDILRGTALGSLELCSTFYMVQKLALSSYFRHYTCYVSSSSRDLLDFLHVKEVGAA